MRTVRFILTAFLLVPWATSVSQAQRPGRRATAARPAAEAQKAGDEGRTPIEAGELEILTRGPLHEAFAALPVEQAIAPPLVREEPPQPLGEQVPLIKPAGNAGWIPGYWEWNDELFYWVWVSGGWRVAPPNRHWTAGYWLKATGGSRWVSGFWRSGDASQLTYMAAVGPEQEQGSGGGNKRPTEFKAGRIWNPAQSYWTPAGYVLVSGYWDYPFDRRGWLFAPLGLADPAADPAQFKLTPDAMLSLANISLELFARPAQRTYYFGDYDNPNHVRHGIVPVSQYAAKNDEPIFSYQNWLYGRQNPNWLRDARAELRSRTVKTSPNGIATLTNLGSRARQTLVSLNEFSGRAEVRDRVTRLDSAQLAAVERQVADLRRAASERRADEMARSATETAAVQSAREAVERAAGGHTHVGHLAAEADEIGRPVGAQPSPTNFKPRSFARRSDIRRDDLNIDSLGSGEDLTADSAIGPGLRLDFAPSLYGTAAVAGRSFNGTGGGSRGMSSRALIYNGLPNGGGNTLGGMSAGAGGVPSFPTGIGSGYQGGTPAGGINAPGGAYGLGSPGGGGAFFGAGGGGTGHGSPGGGS